MNWEDNSRFSQWTYFHTVEETLEEEEEESEDEEIEFEEEDEELEQHGIIIFSCR